MPINTMYLYQKIAETQTIGLYKSSDYINLYSEEHENLGVFFPG